MPAFARRPHWLKRLLVPARPSILFTFDDGPHPAYTPAVLKRLREHDCNAAFFLLGNRIEAAPHLVERIETAGHALGNHTYSHPDLGWLNFRQAHEEVARCQALVPTAKLFRPPFGKLTPGLRLAARRHGLQCLNWTLDSGDWRCRSTADAHNCASEVLELLQPGDIVLFHDNHRWIEPILDVVLPGLEGAGREVVQGKRTEWFTPPHPSFARCRGLG